MNNRFLRMKQLAAVLCIFLLTTAIQAKAAKEALIDMKYEGGQPPAQAT